MRVTALNYPQGSTRTRHREKRKYDLNFKVSGEGKIVPAYPAPKNIDSGIAIGLFPFRVLRRFAF